MCIRLRSYLNIEFGLDHKQTRSFSTQFMHLTDIRHSDLSPILFM